MNVLTIQNLSKSFGKQKIIDNLNLSVPEFYNYMTPIQYLKLCGEVIGLSKVEISKRSKELLSLVGLNGATKQIGGFSRGMKQRLGIAQALLTQPKLLICDEPTSALDPVGRKEILDILYKISGTTTVLFSTHILSDVERICDHAAFLNEGKIAVTGTLAEIKALHGHDSLLLEFTADKDLQLFKKQKSIEPLLLHSEENNRELILHRRDMVSVQKSLFRELAETGICPVRIELMEPFLESLFLEVVK